MPDPTGRRHPLAPRPLRPVRPIDPEVRADDLLLAFRALLAGAVMALDEPGLRNRIHRHTISLTDGEDPAAWARGQFNEAARVTWLRMQRRVYPQLAGDLHPAARLGLVDFDPTPYLAWMRRHAEVAGLLADQLDCQLPGCRLLAARVVGRRPGVAAARAALFRVLPGSVLAGVRRFRD